MFLCRILRILASLSESSSMETIGCGSKQKEYVKCMGESLSGDSTELGLSFVGVSSLNYKSNKPALVPVTYFTAKASIPVKD